MSARRCLTPQIIVPDEDCGPEMLALTPPQRAFVYAFVHFGCNRAEAARRAGYSRNKRENAKVAAYGLWRREGVQAAILEESRKILRAEGPKSIRTLAEIRDNTSNEPKDRLKAAESLLNRGGLSIETVQHVRHEIVDRRSTSELAKDINDRLERLGIVKDGGNVIEAEYTEVPAKSPEQIERASRYVRNGEREKAFSLRTMMPEERERHKQARRETRSTVAKARFQAAQSLDDVMAPISWKISEERNES